VRLSERTLARPFSHMPHFEKWMCRLPVVPARLRLLFVLSRPNIALRKLQA
jgi:hypothetical protein